jgi:hypothetical protein
METRPRRRQSRHECPERDAQKGVPWPQRWQIPEGQLIETEVARFLL